jgi:hypothetical protein
MFWALLTGAVCAAVRFFVPCFIEPGGFGMSRYLGAFVDYTSVPVLFPLAVALFVSRLCRGAEINDFTGFVLLAIVPSAFVCSIPWGARRDMLRLALTPLLWTALAVAFYPVSRLLAQGAADSGGQRVSLPRKTIAVFGFAVFSLLPPLVWWIFFCNRPLYGALLLIPALAPMLAVCISLFRKKRADGGGGTAFKVWRFFERKHAAALVCVLLPWSAALTGYVKAGLARYTFVFRASDTGREVVEERMLARAKSHEANVNRYVEEALLGPLSMEAKPLFSRGARLETFLLRDGVVFLGVSGEAVEEPQAVNLADTLRLLSGGIRRNFPAVKEVRFFIEGGEVVF